jgi:hypothetical protein
MREDTAERATAVTMLTDAEALRRKAVLRRLQVELAAIGIESVLAGRHRLSLKDSGPWSPSGRVDPELHVLGAGNRFVVTTDGERYLFEGSVVHTAADPTGAAAHAAGIVIPAQTAGHEPGAAGRFMGAGERALRQLIDDGVI